MREAGLLLSKKIENALTEAKKINPPRTMEVLFRDISTQLYVINIEPEFLILDHQNARIAAQLKDNSESDTYTKNPEDKRSQDFIAQILKDTEGYGKLKKQLEETRQINPGIISVDGRLIQGNTRAVALREIPRAMAVAVLPADATENDFITVSMTEQMMELVENEFSFTNLLLRIEDHLHAFNQNHNRLIKDMGWPQGKKGQKKINLHREWLELINEMRKEGKPLDITYSFFDDKKEHIINLNEAYRRLINEGDLVGANQMKYARFTAMLLRIPKDQLRTIDEEIFDHQLFETSIFEDFIKDCQPEIVSEDLDEILGPGNKGRISSLKVFKKVSKSFPEKTPSQDFPVSLSVLKDGINEVTDGNVREESRAGIRKFPVLELEKIRKKIEEVRNILPEARQDGAFELGKFKYELKKLTDEIKHLAEDLNSK